MNTYAPKSPASSPASAPSSSHTARSIPISIVLASYKGEAWLAEQLESIIRQMEPEDELLISFDEGEGPGMEIARQYAASHPDLTIRIQAGPGRGVITNFESLLEQVKKPVVVLCDQDDVWLDGKLDLYRKAFEDGQVMAVIHDAAICDESMQVIEPSFYAFHHSKEGYWPNLLRNSMIGCCMAVRKSVVDACLPFPPIPMHDQFLGLQAYRMGKVLFSDQVLLQYRRHEHNASSLEHSSLADQLCWRAQILSALHKRPAPRS